MNQIKFDPFKNLVLDQFEQKIEDDLESGNFVPIDNEKEEISLLKNAANNTLQNLKKNKNINIRLSESTVNKLKLKAAKLGLPYQTLAGSILHQYAHS